MKTSEREALQQQIDALQAKLDSLPKEPAFEPVIGLKPEYAHLYHYTHPDGSIGTLSWYDDEHDNEVFKHQQICKKIEQAKHLSEVSAARLRVLRFIELKNEGWVADFGDEDSMKFDICYDHCSQKLRIANNTSVQFLEQHEYCRTHEIAQQVIDACGDDWKLWKGIKSA